MSTFALEDNTIMLPYTEAIMNYCDKFTCGDRDLDEYFSEDAFLYEKELLGKSFCWISKENNKEIVAIITLSYDGIKTFTLDNSSRNKIQRKIPNKKRHRSYPAVLIGRLGVNSKYQGGGFRIGSQIVQILKYWFVEENNKAACRFILVDAYNSDSTLRFYLKNEFNYLYQTEEREMEAYGIDSSLHSRILYYDLKLVEDK